MALIIAERPESISGCMQTWNEKKTPLVIRTTMENPSTVKVRRRYTTAIWNIEATLTMPSNLYEDFMYWYEVACLAGVNPTYIRRPKDGAELVARFTEPPVIEWVDKGAFRASMRFEQLPAWSDLSNYPPSVSRAPVISGNTYVGAVLTCNAGAYSGMPTPSVTRQWYVNDISQAGQTTTSYTIKSGDVGLPITCKETAINSEGSIQSTSNAIVATAAPIAPTVTAPPVISGSNAIGATLTCAVGSYTGSPTPTVTRQWYVNNIAQSGQTALTYVIKTADALLPIKCKETATNVGGSVDSDSNIITAAEAGTMPSVTTPPSISGLSVVGSTLTCNTGVYAGTPTPSVSRVWLAAGSVISGQTGLTYVIKAGDAGKAISVRETATNTSGDVQSTSNSITATSLPTVTTAPSIAGSTAIGATLTCTAGVYAGYPTPTVTRQWLVNDVVQAETGLTYVIKAGDSGLPIKAKETATNSAGNTNSTSNILTAGSADTAPVNTVLPVISGNTAIGSVLSATTGTWTGTAPITYTYQWRRGGSTIGGATNNTYTLVSADASASITCRVTGTNAAGNATATSNTIVADALPVAPVNTVAPVISGTPSVGSVLSSTTGTWTGTPTPTYTYQWKRGGVNIGSAINNTYTLVTADAGTSITCAVTGTNSAGNNTATSNTLNIDALPVAPSNTVAPVIAGNADVGSTIICSDGEWTGTAPITYTYQWNLEGVPISAAINKTYTPIEADDGKGITCTVTGTNTAGNDSATSNLMYVGTSYLYVNTSAIAPGAGEVYVASASNIIRMNVIDADGTDHSTGLATTVPTDTITIGGQTANVTDSVAQDDHYRITVDSWGALPDGHYPTAIEHAEAGNPELIVNGTFDTNIDGWKLYATAGTLSWDAGVLKVDGGNGNAGAQSETNVTVEVGKTYRVKATWARGTFAANVSLRFYMGHTAGNFNLGNDYNQWQSDTDLIVDATFVASRTVLYVLFATNSINTEGKYSTIDNVSLKEEPL